MRKPSILQSTSMALLAGLALSGSALAGPGKASPDFAAAKAAAFAEADANGDGKLTPEEFANYHVLLRQKLDALHFSRLDTDGDGALTQDELNAGHHGGCSGHADPPR